MTDAIVPQLTARFDELGQSLPEKGVEFWFTRDLMESLGYARWENFITAIQRAIESCNTTGYAAEDHFRGVTKIIEVGKGGQRPVDDFIIAVAHHQFKSMGGVAIRALGKPQHVLYDLKYLLPASGSDLRL